MLGVGESCQVWAELVLWVEGPPGEVRELVLQVQVVMRVHGLGQRGAGQKEKQFVS